MSDSNNKNLLWDDTAIKLIEYATKFRHNADEFERLLGYLLLDVGVETLLRSFLIMFDTKTNPYTFHELVKEVKKVAGSKINEIDLEDAERYHNVRNKIYHQGDGSIPNIGKFEGYLKLAERLLTTLVKDTLTDDEKREEILRKLSLASTMAIMRAEFPKFQLNIGVAAEVFSPKYTAKRLEKSLKEIQRLFGDDEDLSVSDRYEYQLKRIAGFKELTGAEIDDIDFVDEVLNDITYLYLIILLNHKAIEDNDLDNYLQYRTFTERFGRDPQGATIEDKEQLEQLLGWAKKLEEKLDVLIKNQTPSDQQGEES